MMLQTRKGFSREVVNCQRGMKNIFGFEEVNVENNIKDSNIIAFLMYIDVRLSRSRISFFVCLRRRLLSYPDKSILISCYRRFPTQ